MRRASRIANRAFQPPGNSPAVHHHKLTNRTIISRINASSNVKNQSRAEEMDLSVKRLSFHAPATVTRRVVTRLKPHHTPLVTLPPPSGRLMKLASTEDLHHVKTTLACSGVQVVKNSIRVEMVRGVWWWGRGEVQPSRPDSPSVHATRRATGIGKF